MFRLGDVSNVSAIDVTVDDLITPANDEAINPITYTGNGTSYPITNAAGMFTNGFKPNNKYQYTGQVQYPWDLVPTGGPQTEGAFWTTPEDPGAVAASAVTHCSALISAHNSNAATPNPTYTEYSLCAVGTGGVCQMSARIGGTPLSSDPISATVTGLNPGTAYTPGATALVGNQDGSQAGRNSSAPTTGTGFTTLAWGGTPGIANVTTTSADFTFTGLDTTGVVSYQVILNGVSQGTVAGAPSSPIHLSGLTPNTQYTVALKLSESNCTSPTILTQNFTTTPVDPTTFTLSAASPFSLNAGWATGTNPAGTIYQVQYCTDAGFTLNCQTKNSTAGATSATLTTGVNPATTYFAHVKALTIGGGADSNYSNSASATTPPNVQSITISPNTPQTVVTGNTISYTAVVTDPSGNPIPGQAVNWTVSGGGNVSPANGTGTLFTATTPGGPFTVTASLAGYTPVTDSVTVIAAGPVVNSFGFVMAPGYKGGTLTIVGHDNVVHSINSTFSASDSGVTFTPTTTTSADNVAGTTAVTFPKTGTFTLTDNLGSGVSTSTVVVVPQVLSGIKVCAMGDASCSSTITLQTLQTQQFTATGVDQFGNAMSLSSVQWSNNVSASGAQASFSSPMLGQNIRVTATSNGLSGSITIDLVSFDVSNAYAYPVPYKASTGTGVIHFVGFRFAVQLAHLYY